MRYPIWLFMFVFVIPPSQLHAVLTGGARIEPVEKRVTVSQLAPSSHIQVTPVRASFRAVSRPDCVRGSVVEVGCKPV